MTEGSDPLENTVAERIHRTIKEEFTTDWQINFSNIVQAKKELKSSLSFITSIGRIAVCNG